MNLEKDDSEHLLETSRELFIKLSKKEEKLKKEEDSKRNSNFFNRMWEFAEESSAIFTFRKGVRHSLPRIIVLILVTFAAQKLIILSLIGLDFLSNTDWKSSLLLLTTSLLIFPLITGLVRIFNSAKNSRNAVDDFEIFAGLINHPFSVKLKEINELNRLTDKILTKARFSLGESLITWEDSAHAEIKAKAVKTMTPDLNWLFAFRHLNDGVENGKKTVFQDIIKDVVTNDNSYIYIVYEKANPSLSNGSPTCLFNTSEIIKNLENLLYLYRNENKRRQEKIRNNVKIKFLMNNSKILEFDWKENADSMIVSSNILKNLMPLPLPGDMVLYEETYLPNATTNNDDARVNVLVASKNTISIDRRIDVSDGFDFMFLDSSQISSFQNCFNYYLDLEKWR